MSEAWWDEIGGWMFSGSGELGPDGQPTGLAVPHVRSGAIAQLAGYAWSLTSQTWNACSVDFNDYAL